MRTNVTHDLPDGKWLISGGLLYRLKDGANCDEINVAMAGGSRDTLNRECVAEYLLKVISEAHAKDAQIATLTACVATHKQSVINAAAERDANLVDVGAVPEAAAQNGGLVRAALIDLLTIEHLTLTAIADFSLYLDASVRFARARVALAATTLAAAPAQPIAPPPEICPVCAQGYMTTHCDECGITRELAMAAQPIAPAADPAYEVFFNGAWKPATEQAYYSMSEKNRRIAPAADVSAPTGDENYDALRAAIIAELSTHRMVHLYEMEDDGPGAKYPLIDQLSLEGGTIGSGKDEIEAIADAVLDALAARAAAPVSGPTDNDNDKALGYLDDILEAKEVMRLAGIAQNDFPSMFKEFAALKSAAPVRGPTNTVQGLYSDADRTTLAFMGIGTSDSAAPVSGQGASIGDDAEFNALLVAYRKSFEGLPDKQRMLSTKAAIYAYIDSLPRSEDSRAKVLKSIAAMLEMYAENYDVMARIGSTGTVHCGTVATDIRNNMIAFVLDALASTPTESRQ